MGLKTNRAGFISLFVARALVAEALEISFFMARVNSEEQNQELQDLDMKDWAW